MTEIDAIIEQCEQGHKFAKLPDHPRKDGLSRCPHCMAIGLDAARDALSAQASRVAELERALKRAEYDLIAIYAGSDGPVILRGKGTDPVRCARKEGARLALLRMKKALGREEGEG